MMVHFRMTYWIIIYNGIYDAKRPNIQIFYAVGAYEGQNVFYYNFGGENNHECC